MDNEFEAYYLEMFRQDVELPKAELRHRLIRELVDGDPEPARPQLWLRLGLRRLGEQMIAAGEWLARANGERADFPTWTELP
jgi:hypothetical protein